MTFDPRRRSFTTNKYNYAGNSPVHYVDPSGMLHISIVKNSVKLFPCGGSQVTYKVSPSQLEFPLTDDDIVIIQYTCSYIGRYRLCEYRGPRAKVDQTTRCGCHLTKEINPRKCCFYESLDGGGEDIHLTPPITKPFCTSAGSLTSITNLRVYFRTAEIDAEIAKKFKERVFTCNDGLNDHVVAAGAVSFEAPDFWKKAELIMESGSSIATMDWDCCEGGGYHRLEFEMSVSSGKPGKPIEIEFPDLPNPR